MRQILLLLLVACDTVDPRSVCPWELHVVDSVTGEVELRESLVVACRPAETTPDRVLFEAIARGDAPVTEFDPAVLCDGANLYTALEVEALPAPTYTPWADDPSGVVVYEDASRAVQGAWFAVTFLEVVPEGGFVSEQPWGAFFQLGVADSAVERNICND